MSITSPRKTPICHLLTDSLPDDETDVHHHHIDDDDDDDDYKYCGGGGDDNIFARLDFGPDIILQFLWIRA